MDFDETRDEQDMVIDGSSPKAPNLESTLLKPHIEETMAVQFHDLIDETMEIQAQVQQVEAREVLPLEEKSLLSSSIIPP